MNETDLEKELKSLNKLKIAILAAFSDAKSAYSLISVVAAQCKMLERIGAKYVLYVNEDFDLDNRGELDKLNLSPVMPIGLLHEDVINEQLEENFEEWAEKELKSKEFNVVITHDLMFQTWFISHNSALRRVMKNSNAKWLHWQHSLPGQRQSNFPAALRTSKAPNSIYVSLSETEALALAESVGVNKESIRVCYNPLDAFQYFGLDKNLESILKSQNVLEADLIQFFPFSMPRWKEKGVHKVIRIFKQFKALGFSVKVILANAHSQNCRNEIKELKRIIDYYDMKDEVIMFSDADIYEIDRQQVKALFALSDIFIFPTVSEACSLVLLEASMAGNLIVGNSDLQNLHEFLDSQTPHYHFGSLKQKTSYGGAGEDEWLEQVATSLLPEIKNNTALKQKRFIRKQHSYSWILRNQIIPLLID